MDQYADIVKPKLVKAVVWGLLLGLIIAFLLYFETILKPLFIAFFIWILIKELRHALGKIKINGKAMPSFIRGTIAIIMILSFLFFQVEIIILNARAMAENAPEYHEKVQNLSNFVSKYFLNPDVKKNIDKWIKEIDVPKLAGVFANSFTSAIGHTFIILIYLIFMLLEEFVFTKKIRTIFPEPTHKFREMVHVAYRINDSIRKYFMSKTIVSLLLAIICYIVLILFGVDFPVFWAFLIFILNYIPFVGSFFATLFPSIMAVFQFGDFSYFLYVFISVEAVQIIMANVVEPKLMGKNLNLSPLTVLIALALWGYLWGIIGMILAVPITAMLAIIFAQFPESKYVAILLSEKGDVAD